MMIAFTGIQIGPRQLELPPNMPVFDSAGYALGRYAHYRPWTMGLGMALFGVVLVAITVYLGG
jgi:hypothetical protein